MGEYAALDTDEARLEYMLGSLSGSGLDVDQQVATAKQLMYTAASATAKGVEVATAVAKRSQELVTVATTANAGWSCPKMRFGRTEIQMPIITCGGMRMQQAWGPKITEMEQVDPHCQENFVAIIRKCLKLGINHFETARAYGCSELQYGEALKVLLDSGEVKREDIIIQTKGGANPDPAKFREMIELSFRLLDSVGHIDLFAFHGLNRDASLSFAGGAIASEADQLDWILRPGGCMDIMLEYKKAGKVKHIGFSTHGQTATIVKAIETGKFDYINFHYHYIGSYTASGASGAAGGGNAAAMAAAKKQDMGLFCISPVDKGGHLYAPSVRLAELCAPELTPLEMQLLWGWQSAGFHTQVIGAARPSDFDAAVAAAVLHADGSGAPKLAAATARLDARLEAALGSDWAKSWWVGLPSCFENKCGTHATNMVWYWNLIQAFGMFDYCKARYGSQLGNSKKWEHDKSWDENMAIQDWGFMPGCALGPGGAAALKAEGALDGCPNADKVVEILDKVHVMLAAAGMSKEPDWEEAYDMRPWEAFCERGPDTKVTRASYLK